TTPLRTPKYLAYPFALARMVREAVAAGATYDALVAQHSISAVAAGQLRTQLRVPVVFNLLDCLTGFMETWPPLLMPRQIARALVRYELGLPRRYQADGVLTVSDELRNRVVARGYPAARVLAAYYGFDADRFTPSSPHHESPSGKAPMVVMHGSFDHHHLGPIALQAVRHVAQCRPDVRFRFVGPLTPALRTFAGSVRRHVPRANLELTGFVPYIDIPAQLADATVGLTPYQPSSGTHCAFVAKTVEYLGLGLPVVSTPLQSSLQYYAGLRGITFSDDAGTDFGPAVLRWLDLPQSERSAAVEPARLKVHRELNWPTLCARATDFVETVAQSPSTLPASR
ncbi:MAG: glycosyltransferase family 4 protein, partial [Verrucomicrobiales bacterium]|nr:glycosyltransferase family 4 protein [Verrucomicrobiales bacterium]